MEEILIQIYEWFFGNPYGVTIGVVPLAAAGAAKLGIGAIASIGGTLISGIGALFGGGRKRREAYRARLERDRLKGELSVLEKNRQAIINPYAGVTDISSMAKDLSGMVSNPYANLGVATQAADMQIEEADIALANTLDTLRATGASAGGATALAQAALQSKKGVSANIEQQEAQNEKLKAQGEQQLQQLKMSEQQRLQSIAISEGQRVQSAQAAGKQFMFQAKENRTNMDLNRAAGQISQAQQQQADANAAKASAIGGALTGIGNIAGAAIGAYAPGK